MLFRWFPWRYLVRRLARSHGFIDPFALLSRLDAFAQPSEVAIPVELLRAGIVFHARGLINTKVIQQNLDWVWPYWACRQFDPEDESFLPRAFSVTHVNLTHRNWTAIGLPDFDALPIVDPSGLVTPHFDGWSLDAWIIGKDGAELIPARMQSVEQQLVLPPDALHVRTEAQLDGLKLVSTASVRPDPDGASCIVRYEANAAQPAWLAISVRPYNPEGISFVNRTTLIQDGRTWRVDEHPLLRLSHPPERAFASTYHEGDVYHGILSRSETREATCPVGMVTAAALYELAPGKPRSIEVEVPLEASPVSSVTGGYALQAATHWQDALDGSARLDVPDKRFQMLYDAAIRSIVMHAPGDVYPGPYTYKRFWFRDAAFILHALLCTGFTGRVRRSLDTFVKRQRATGYFCSQDGEWDSNGEVLWILERFCRLAGRAPEQDWRRMIRSGGKWIGRKRTRDTLDKPHAGLMPAGFSAEHLGNNDFYYWDDFWSIAGLRAAARLMSELGDDMVPVRFNETADALEAAIEHSLQATAPKRTYPGIPASPYRRMDSGAVGSLVVAYPLQLRPPEDAAIQQTAEFLLDNCLVHGAFFQDMIHSGINAYLTLHLAQVLLRNGDTRWFELVRTAAELASPTGQWPEAIHPRTFGGCMGDGHHVWASAEWAMMMRNMFIREEGDGLIIGSGIPREWLQQPHPLHFGPAPTPWGPITITIEPQSSDGCAMVRWDASWREMPPVFRIAIPGCTPQQPDPAETSEVQVTFTP